MFNVWYTSLTPFWGVALPTNCFRHYSKHMGKHVNRTSTIKRHTIAITEHRYFHVGMNTISHERKFPEIPTALWRLINWGLCNGMFCVVQLDSTEKKRNQKPTTEAYLMELFPIVLVTLLNPIPIWASMVITFLRFKILHVYAVPYFGKVNIIFIICIKPLPCSQRTQIVSMFLYLEITIGIYTIS